MEYNASGGSHLGMTTGAVIELESKIPTASTPCDPFTFPTFEEYIEALNDVGIALFTLGGAAVLIVLGFYAATLRHVLMTAPTAAKTHTAFIITVYPVVSIATYCSIIVPRAQPLCEALAQGMFMVCLYQLFCLLVDYCGGEAQLIKKVRPNRLSLQVNPCCCWPCFSFLPTFEMTKKTILGLRLLILQLPVIQAVAYLVILVMWAEKQNVHKVNYNIIQPIVILSILVGIWSVVMTTTVTAKILQGYNIRGKYISLQLVLLFSKFQGLLLKLLATKNVFPCKSPITPTVYANLTQNSLLLWEMVVLCIASWILYRRPIPVEPYPTDSNSNIPGQISTITHRGNLNDDNKSNTNGKF